MTGIMSTQTSSNRKAVLLVDDHPDVLVTTGAFLEAAGFDVVRAASGDEALARLASGQIFALLVTDYAMPGLNGVDLATQALERLPNLKALIITGFPSDAGLFDRPSSVALLAKPFRRSALIAQLDSLFGSVIGSLQPAGSAHNESHQWEDQARQRDAEGRQRDVDSHQRHAEGRQRDVDSHQRDVEGYQRGAEARQREAEGYQRDGIGGLHNEERRQREDDGRQREDEGRQREDGGRQREDEGRQREILLERRARYAEEVRRWTDVLHNVAFGIGIVDGTSKIIHFANEALARMHGISVEGLCGSPLISLYAPAERKRVDALYDTVDRKGHVVFEADRIRKDGSVFPSEVHITSVCEKSGDVLYHIVTVQDITLRRQTEIELDQSRRLQAIGQLTAGVAHDFNNLLQGIMANLELVNDDIDVAPATREYVDSAVRLAEHGGEVTHRLLSFARKQLLAPKAVDLPEFLVAFRDLLSHTLDPRIRITMESGPGLTPVWVDPAHLQAALLNVAINARDAMPSGGNLRIEVLSKLGAATDAEDSGSPDRFATIRISDTGTGIAPDILAKVCEPFFSTKGLNGTGLGLSMAHGFFKQSGGDLLITSELGKGTCVEVWLPMGGGAGQT